MNSSAMFLHGGAGVNGYYEVLLLDEDRGWLLVGGRDHVYMLNSESLTQITHKVANLFTDHLHFTSTPFTTTICLHHCITHTPLDMF